MPKTNHAAALTRALQTIPAQAFVTRDELVAFGAALVEMLTSKEPKKNKEDYATLTDLCRDYKAGRKQMSEILATHLVRKLILPAGGVRYHREDVRAYLTSNFSAHTSAPDFA